MVMALMMATNLFAQAQSDSELIMSRIRYRIKPTNLSLVESVVKTYLPLIQDNGSWADLNYQDINFSDGWEPQEHNERLLAFAQAYVLNSTYKGNSSLYYAIEKGLRYYYQVNPTTTHWWTLEIEAPQMILSTLIFMREGTLSLPSELESNIVNRFNTLPEPTKHGIGANRSDVALWHLYQAVLRDSHEQIVYASEHLFNSLVLTTGNGIQHDYSYMDHGPQLYTYSYGLVMMNNINKAAGYLSGTAYAMPTQYLSVYAQFLKSGYSSCLRGKYVSFSTLGRSISRPNQVLKYTSAFSKALTIDPDNASFYQSVVDRSKGIVGVGHGIAPAYTHYYRSKFSTHNREAFLFTVLTTSDRTEKTEMGNGENLKGLFLADGATNFMVNGDEYYNIFPVWDWSMIPGTTVPAKTNLTPTGTWGTLGTSVFTGGVSNGAYGAHVFAMNDYDTEVKKAWFCFDEEVVCLGAGLTSSATQKVNTTLNQCLLDGDVVVAQNGATSMASKGSKISLDNSVDWLWHDQVGYVFPDGGNLMLSTQTQTGSWADINRFKSNSLESRDVFKLWIDHGMQPQNDAYAYIVVPGKTTVGAMQAYNSDNVEIVSNTKNIQAVRNLELDMVQVVFYKAGTLTTENMVLGVDQPCIMVLKNVSSSLVNMSIADPGEKSSVIQVSYQSAKIPEVQTIKCTMPVGKEKKGSTVNYQIGRNKPVSPESVVCQRGVLHDAFVRGGDYSNVNYNSNYLLTKKTSDNAYTREVFLKFDLTNLPAQTDSYLLRLNVSSDIMNSWKVSVCKDDNWTETTLTWDTKPAVHSFIGNFTNTSALFEIDITDAVNNELAGDQILTLKIESAVDQVYAAFTSKEDADVLKHPLILCVNPVSTHSTTTELNEIVIYPNPSQSKCFIRNIKEGTAIALYTLAGNLVKSEKYQSGIDISELSRGIYVVVMYQNGKKLSLKLQKH